MSCSIMALIVIGMALRSYRKSVGLMGQDLDIHHVTENEKIITYPSHGHVFPFGNSCKETHHGIFVGVYLNPLFKEDHHESFIVATSKRNRLPTCGQVGCSIGFAWLDFVITWFWDLSVFYS